MKNKRLEEIYRKTADVTPLPFPVFSDRKAQAAIETALNGPDSEKAALLIQNEWNTLAGGYDSMGLLLSFLIGYKVMFCTKDGAFIGDRCRFHIDGFEITEEGAGTTDEMEELLQMNPPDITYNNITIPFKYKGFLFYVDSIRCEDKILKFILTPADKETDMELNYKTVFKFPVF